MRAGPGESGGTILEAFKPGTAPPDNYSVIGVADADGRTLTVAPDDRPQHHASGHRRAVLADCALRAPAATSPDNIGLAASAARSENTMRAEVERLVEEIKQSVGLLRRHL